MDWDARSWWKWQKLRKEEIFSREDLCVKSVVSGGKIEMNPTSPMSADGRDLRQRQSVPMTAAHGELLSAKITSQETCLRKFRTG